MNSAAASPNCSPDCAEPGGRWLLAGWVVVALLAAAAVLANAPAPRRILLLLAGLGGGYALWRSADGRALAPWLLPWFVLTPLSALWSPLPATTAVDALGEAILPVLAGFAARALAARIDARWRLLPFAVVLPCAALAALGGLHEHAGWWPAAPQWLIAAYAGRGVASTLGVLLTLAGGALLVERRRPALAGALIACGLLLGILGYNRMFWLALAVGLLPWLAGLRRQPAGGRRLAAGALAALLVAGIAWSSLHPKQPGAPGQTAVASYADDPRWRIWVNWLAAAEERPLLGYGWGSRVLPRIGESQVASLSPELDWAARHHAHNVLINVFVQTGALGLIAFAALLAGAWRALAAAPPGPWRTAALSLLLAALAKSLTDDFFWGPAGILMWLLAGLCAGFARRPGPELENPHGA